MLLRRPVQQLYPIEVGPPNSSNSESQVEHSVGEVPQSQLETDLTPETGLRRSHRSKDEMEDSPQRDGNSANLPPPPAPRGQGGFPSRVAETHEEENYAGDYAILLPRRIPGVRNYEKAKLLPSSVSLHMVYRLYADAGREHALSESSFKRIWRMYVPHIYNIKPMTDICSTCKKNSTAILRNAGCEIERQSEVKVAAKEYIDPVRQEYCVLFRTMSHLELMVTTLSCDLTHDKYNVTS
uniref:Uncharacterized protein n=1 Tax=Amphimedon queenslandica TaxID=400682 RepID=A0A1X7TRD8_AMPQE